MAKRANRVFNCSDKQCWHDYCDRNRRECDSLVPVRPGIHRQCGERVVWRAPDDHELFPLSFCAEHDPRPAASPAGEGEA